MTDTPDDPPQAETAMQRALRLKKASLAARPRAPGAGTPGPRQSSAQPSGASKPWMKK
ncbi:hypothetical protein [Phenylobacterium sp.]|jgi:hypothetical protein|uniref:hypothetical protein n=1 Tax=Phenylobacterium sp. TaxID=1871053 RepID=UPI002F95BF3D